MIDILDRHDSRQFGWSGLVTPPGKQGNPVALHLHAQYRAIWLDR
jgi:hypothetical protein